MPRTLVGLDIGSTGVRAAEFVPGRRRTRMRRFASVSLAPGVVRAGRVVDPEALSSALRALWAEGRFTTRDVALGIASSGVLVRQLDLDWMPAADFRKALRYQVQDVLPFSVDEANLDHHLLEELEIPGDGDQVRRVSRILLVAAAQDVVDAFVEAVRGARLRPASVDLLPFALLRARTSVLGVPSGTTEAIVDIGSDVISVVVHTDGVPRYVRVVPDHGGDTVTEAVRAEYDWAWEDAERTKVFAGLPGHARFTESQRQAVRGTADGLDHPAQRTVAQASGRLADEIATTLDFYRDSAPENAAVDQVLLAGAGALLSGFDDQLSRRLDVPVERLDVASRVTPPRRWTFDEIDRSALAAVAGLAGVNR